MQKSRHIPIDMRWGLTTTLVTPQIEHLLIEDVLLTTCVLSQKSGKKKKTLESDGDL